MFTRIKDVMTRTSTCLQVRHTLKDVLKILADKGIEGLPVQDEYGQMLGIVTKESLLDTMLDTEQITENLLAWQFAKPIAAYLEEDAYVKDVWNLAGVVFPVFDKTGRFTGVISEKQLKTTYCRLSEYRVQELDAVFNSAHNGIVAIDAQGFITSFNPAAERLSKRSREEAIGKFLTEVVAPTGLLEVVRTGQPQFAKKYQVGRRKYITNRTPIIQDGHITGAVGVFQDVSEMEEIYEELSLVKELNKELETVVESSYDGIVVTDSQGKILRANRAFGRIIGARADVIGLRLQEVVESEVSGVSLVEMVLQQMGTVSIVYNNQTPQKSLIFTANPVLNETNQVVRIVINVRDIGELNKVKQQLEKTCELSKRYKSELEELRLQLMRQEGIVAHSTGMKKVLELALRVAQVDSTVLILGESGVGKEIVAKIIHSNSLRRQEPFIKINCGAIPETLLESELFGYEAGAFTGASRTGKAGLFELANNGTLFLDEIGDLPASLQAKLLRALQDKELVRLGGAKPRSINVHIVAATNQNLLEKVRQGQFREDLYFRLNVVPIHIPPLRERREDIIPLLFYFRDRFSEKFKQAKDFSPKALELLVNYDWPGNVRELENVVERLFVTNPGELITDEALNRHLVHEVIRIEQVITVSGLVPLKKAVEEVERQLLEKALQSCDTTYKVAELLNVNQSTVVRKLNKYKTFSRRWE
ncbi:MAG: sigma 54-interacting transcriptional regulator [Bacillota bacterium]